MSEIDEIVAALPQLAARVRHLEAVENASLSEFMRYAGIARCDSTLNLTSSYQDVSGCTKTLTIPTGGQTLLIMGTFDFEIENTSSTVNLVGQLVADGSAQTGKAFFQGGAAGERGTVTQAWIVTLTAGSRIIKLQAKNDGSGTSGWATQTATQMVWMRPIVDES